MRNSESPTGCARGAVTVAAFDLDGTLTHGGSVVPFLIRVRGFVPVLLALLRGLPGMLRAALFGGKAADHAKELLFSRLLTGIPEDRIDKVAERFAEEHLARRARPQMVKLVALHKMVGHKVVIVSASPECYVRAIARLLDVDAALATRLEVGGGMLTGHFSGPNCRGGEKFARLVGWFRSDGLLSTGQGQPMLWAYGNSRGDRRLLEAADHGIDAGRLGKLGRLRHFTRVTKVLAEAGIT